MNRSLRFMLFFVLLLGAAVSVLAQDALPDEIEFTAPGLHPEGIEWDAEGGRFLVSSLPQHTVSEVFDDGTVNTFIADEDLAGTIGIHIDHANNRLLVANSDIGIFSGTSAGSAALGSFDLTTGERIFVVNLSGMLPDAPHFANDVTSDADGNAYVTDSFSPVIYRVDLEGNASIFLQSDALANAQIGLNGIDYHPDGYLLVALGGAGEIYKVPLADPESFTQVGLSEPLGIDGMILDEAGDLIAVATTFDADGNAVPEIVAVHSADAWATAEVVARFDSSGYPSPTTIAERNGVFYFVNANFDGLFAGQSTETFIIARADLGAMMSDEAVGNAENGAQLFASVGCSACHNNASEATLVGPGLLNVGTRAATRVEGLSAVDYIRQSIRTPSAYVVEGFPNGVMPQTFGQTLSDEQINDLIAYLLTLHD